MSNSKYKSSVRYKSARRYLLLIALSITVFAPISLFASGSASKTANDQLLPLKGDIEQGKKLFWDLQGKVACATCHTVNGKGGKVGPELTSVAATRPLKYIAESVLLPSAVIVKGFDPVLIQLNSGARITGVLKNETPEGLVVTLADGTKKEFPRTDISRFKILKKSIMPGNFAELLSVEEFANLLAYVQTLKGSAGATKASAVKKRSKKQESHSAKVYTLYCTQCHGATANGKGINAPHLTIQPKNHSNSKEMGSLTDAGIFLAIKEGGMKVGRSSQMPPFGGALSDDEITGLVGHLRKLCNC